MKVATFNINGILRRMPNLLDWLRSTTPDVVCLQELKTDQNRFPSAALRDAGYASVRIAEGAYNGVAILVKGAEPIDAATDRLALWRDREVAVTEAAEVDTP